MKDPAALSHDSCCTDASWNAHRDSSIRPLSISQAQVRPADRHRLGLLPEYPEHSHSPLKSTGTKEAVQVLQWVPVLKSSGFYGTWTYLSNWLPS